MHAFRFARVLGDETKNVEICVYVSCRTCFWGRDEHAETRGKVCMCRLVPVFRARAKNEEIRMCVCRLVPVFRARAKNEEIRVCVCVVSEANTVKIVKNVCVSGSWGVPHDSQKVNIFTQRARLQSATFWCPGKTYFYV